VCRVYNQDEPSATSSNNKFGAWIFGDFSSNILEYWFRDNSNTNIPLFVDTLNWTGWKFKELDLGSFGQLKFHSFVIHQVKGEEKKGQVYFDAILTDVVTDVENQQSQLPTKFNLEQNYPNPFNPTTTIKYTIPMLKTLHATSQRVQIRIYDILGKEVALLVNKEQTSGNYKVVFDANKLSSGVYYYQLKAGNFLKTKKMILLR
jgi:hypothetical protein